MYSYNRWPLDRLQCREPARAATTKALCVVPGVALRLGLCAFISRDIERREKIETVHEDIDIR